MERSAMEEIERWYDVGEKKCLMIDGARGVGKTYLVREFAKRKDAAYYYSEEEPPMDHNKSYYLGDWWHWVDGKPEIRVMD